MAIWQFICDHDNGVTNFHFEIAADILDEEEKSLELQYRNKHVYGTGLGTAVNWNINERERGSSEMTFSRRRRCVNGL